MTASASEALRSRLGRWAGLLAAVVAVLGVATACALLLQYSTHLNWARRSAPDVLFSGVDVLVIAVLIAGVWAVVGRLWAAVALVCGATMVLAVINHTKIVLRREPLFPSDRSFAADLGSLTGMVDARTMLLIAGGVAGTALIALVGWGVGRGLRRLGLRPPVGGRRARVASRLVVATIAAVLLVQAAWFNQPHNPWRALYDGYAAWKPWSQLENYRRNGFVGGVLYNMPIDVMPRPVGYGEDELARVARDYAARAAAINADRRGSLADTNVVFILSESFTDPTRVAGVDLAEDPIPFTRQVMSQTTAGQMYSLSYGGGTSTMEFESLTGQSVGLFNPQVSSPYQMFLADRDTYPSAVGAFAQTGHRTVAIHSYNLDMYKRRQVYGTLGFDEVVDDAHMQSRRRIETSRYVSDAAAFDEVLYQLDRTEGPEFVNLVTMQNHGDYDDSYSDPIASGIEDPKAAGRYGQYVRGLAHTDEALRDFLGRLQERDETTVVVFYGDHHPGIYDDATLEADVTGATLRTPFFVWNSRGNRAEPVPAIGPAMFLPLVYEAADAPVPPYVALLDDVRHALPVIQPSRTVDAAGRLVDPAALDAPTSALLADLRLVQYDFAVGSRYAVDRMWPGSIVR